MCSGKTSGAQRKGDDSAHSDNVSDNALQSSNLSWTWNNE